MIKFFRNIRQKLLSENKFSKYLIYAIGEIILVVIGILIALSINNWNEERKQKAIEVSYLKRLLIDLEEDKNLWASIYERRKNQVQIIQDVISLKYKPEEERLNFNELAPKLKTAATWSDINPNQQTYTEMLSSGNLDIIKNDSIKIKLINLHRDYKAIASWDETVEASHARMFDETLNLYDIRDSAPFDIMFSEYNTMEFTPEQKATAYTLMLQSFEQIMNSKKMFNVLHMMSDNYHRQLSTFRKLEENVSDIADLIKSELKHRSDD
ncbi:DUF6090 family protein [Winogradskyella maritima]|uniref:DUF6090 family protein n=1 Tax=Winogradskyella maritima TaxID=1517766 RepID=A0ABV8AHF8_9FLAO|nr:DUF6090 family protein [Winogradskyella maritima]